MPGRPGVLGRGVGLVTLGTERILKSVLLMIVIEVLGGQRVSSSTICYIIMYNIETANCGNGYTILTGTPWPLTKVSLLVASMSDTVQLFPWLNILEKEYC